MNREQILKRIQEVKEEIDMTQEKINNQEDEVMTQEEAKVQVEETESDKEEVVRSDVKKNSTTSATIKKLKSKKTYSVKIRAYKKIDGKKIYGDYSKVKKIKVK